ncbi:MAG: queuosine precursor transporter [Saprospiraceae bacterium]|nr:queuosine precursor transporter [Saprospiraceae bacterium]
MNRIPHNLTTLTPSKKQQPDLLKDKSAHLFLILSGFFIANALIAEFMGVKIFSLERTIGATPVNWNLLGGKWNFDLSAGVLLWPVVFIMTDIINEYYGRRGVKFLSWLGAGLIAYAFFMLGSSIKLVPADWWNASQQARGVVDMNASYNGIFGQGLGIIIGSLTAFILAQILDVTVFHQIKKWTGESKLWLRATGSTLLSQLVDTFVVVSVAFYFYPMLVPGNGEPWSITQLLTVCTGGYLYKFFVAVAMTPVVYGVHNLIERYLGADLAAEMKKTRFGAIKSAQIILMKV